MINYALKSISESKQIQEFPPISYSSVFALDQCCQDSANSCSAFHHYKVTLCSLNLAVLQKDYVISCNQRLNHMQQPAIIAASLTQKNLIQNSPNWISVPKEARCFHSHSYWRISE